MSTTVGVVGLGYVGLPLSVLFAEAGLQVIAYDYDEYKVKSLLEGKVYIEDISEERYAGSQERIRPTSNPEDLSRTEFVAICVPTPIKEDKSPNTEFVESAVRTIKPYLKRGAVVSIESTVYPNFTKDIIAPELPGIHVVFSPERVDPSNSKFDLKDVPKVIGSDSEIALSLARDVYSKVFSLVEVSSTSTAEMTKLLENTYRAVNIALANEISRMCTGLGVNVWEVIRAASTKPFGFQAFYPSMGVGGHCIPVDPYYLLYKQESDLIRKSLEINRASTAVCIERITPSCWHSLLACKPILFLGVSYKPDVADIRESPAIDMITSITHLVERTYHRFPKLSVDGLVKYYDPHNPSIDVPNIEGSHTHTILSEIDIDKAISEAGTIVVCVNHSKFSEIKDRLMEKATESETSRSLTPSSQHSHIFDFCGMFQGDTKVSGL